MQNDAISCPNLFYSTSRRIQVRAMLDEGMMRQVFQCKDRSSPSRRCVHEQSPHPGP